MSIPAAITESFDGLASELRERFDAWDRGVDGGGTWGEELLDGLACRAFEIQYAANDPYGRYCRARGVTPGSVGGWRDVPSVPTAAFRAVDLIVGQAADARLVFLSSGTTRGGGPRARHLVRDPALYRSSLQATFRGFVWGHTPRKIITLPPSFTHTPDSSLGWMLDEVRRAFGAAGSVSVSTPDGIDWPGLRAAVEDATGAGVAVALLGTTLAFAEWRERLAGEEGVRPLVAGSLVMDTGGSKGRPGVQREEVVRDLQVALGLPADAIVNEFGMTELLSQRYGRGAAPGPLLGPPWLRTRVLDPVTLEEMPPGEAGILCDFDLANLGSVCGVLTEDRGRAVGEGIEWLGRTPGAPPRGCSLATAELLEAQRDA